MPQTGTSRMNPKLASAFSAGADPDREAVKLAKEMQAVFKGEDRKVYTDGWKMSGRLQSKSAYFSKPNYTMSGITGEAQMLYDGEKLTSFSFWTDGSDAAYSRLYQLLVGACGGAGRSTVYDRENGKVEWTIVGSKNRYEVDMSQNKLVDRERGVTIIVKDRKAAD